MIAPFARAIVPRLPGPTGRLATSRLATTSGKHASAPREVVSREERALRRAARKERANVYMSRMGESSAESGSATTSANQAAVSRSSAATAASGRPMIDTTRLGWYAAVIIPFSIVGWGVVDEDSPPAKLFQMAGLKDMMDDYAAPTREKLLPDWNQIPNVPPDMPPPPLLVLDLEHTLVAPTWDRKFGWRYSKRPGVDKFLSTLAQYYEIVLFTPSIDGLAAPVIASLDPKGYIMHHLYRESTHYVNGVHCKDLSSLNRNVKKIVALDDEKAALQFQPDNLIRVKAYDDPSDRDDNTLERILPLLIEISREGYDDIPGLLQQFRGMDADQIADEHERRVNNLRIQHGQISQRGLGSFAHARNLPPPELPPQSIGGSEQPKQLTAKDLVGSAPPSVKSESGMIGWLQKRQQQQEENNKDKMQLWNEVMLKKQDDRKKAMEEQRAAAA